MNRCVALAALALVLSRPLGAAPPDDPFKNVDCNKAQVQIELDYCADKAFQAEDRKLNVLYRKLMSSYDAKDQALLRTAEKNWLAYRDSECEFETSGSEGGSIHPMEGSNCLAEKTKAHIKELQATGQ